jgi:hypothetical protein
VTSPSNIRNNPGHFLLEMMQDPAQFRFGCLQLER